MNLQYTPSVLFGVCELYNRLILVKAYLVLQPFADGRRDQTLIFGTLESLTEEEDFQVPRER